MKCRNCDNDAIYEDGLCEECHRRSVEQEAEEPRVQVMSQSERENFRGTTIDEDGSVHNPDEDNRTAFDSMFGGNRQGQGGPHVHVYTSSGEGLPLRIKLAAGFIIFVIIAIIISALGVLVLALPYLLAAAAIIIVFKVITALLKH